MIKEIKGFQVYQLSIDDLSQIITEAVEVYYQKSVIINKINNVA